MGERCCHDLRCRADRTGCDVVSNAKHTPPPWHVDSFGCYGDYKLRVCEPMRSGFPLATIAQFEFNWKDAGQFDRQISYKEAEANALLASAAPELLDALEGLLSMTDFSNDEPWITAAHAAIAKAKG
jgi:hypothetical protein